MNDDAIGSIFAKPFALLCAAALVLAACGQSEADEGAATNAPTTTETADEAGPSSEPDSQADATEVGIDSDRPIVSAQLVADALESGRPIQVIDARLVDEWEEGHIPGALVLPSASLAVTRDGVEGMAAAPEDLAAAFGAAGVRPDGVTAVVYDADGGTLGSRLVWLLESMGHPDVRFLDGGLSAWVADGQDLTEGPEQAAVTDYPVRWQDDGVATADFIEANLDTEGVVLLDTRTEAEYTGTDVRAAVGGHIPGAVLRDWTEHRTADGRVLSMDELRDHYEGTGVFDADTVIVYCQSGKRATHTYLVLRALGVEDVRLYDASWLEWGNSERPVETDPETDPDPESSAVAADCDITRTSDLGGAILVGCDLTDIDLAGATMVEADLSGAILRGARLDDADLSRAIAPGADLSDALARDADLGGIDLSSADLTDADLNHADLSRASLVGARLTGANLEHAWLADADVTGVIWGDTVCPDGTNSDENGGSCDGHLKAPFVPQQDPCE